MTPFHDQAVEGTQVTHLPAFFPKDFTDYDKAKTAAEKRAKEICHKHRCVFRVVRKEKARETDLVRIECDGKGHCKLISLV
jgi:hypothetical protein